MHVWLKEPSLRSLGVGAWPAPAPRRISHLIWFEFTHIVYGLNVKHVLLKVSSNMFCSLLSVYRKCVSGTAISVKLTTPNMEAHPCLESWGRDDIIRESAGYSCGQLVRITTGFQSGVFSINPKFRSIITPRLFTQLFEYEFRAQNFFGQNKCFHMGLVGG